jgi:hypothetical protein
MKPNRRLVVRAGARLACILLLVALVALAVVGCKKGAATPAPTRTPGIVPVTPSVEAPTTVPQPSPTLASVAPATAAPTTQSTVAPPTPGPQPTQPPYPGPLPEVSPTPGPYPSP